MFYIYKINVYIPVLSLEKLCSFGKHNFFLFKIINLCTFSTYLVSDYSTRIYILMENQEKATKPSNYVNALPYLSVLPITEQCLDFFIIDKIEKGLAKKTLQLFLSKEEINEPLLLDLTKAKGMPLSEIEQRKALHKSFEDFQAQKESLSIGYPLFLMDDSKLGKPIAAPLFLWKVELNLLEGSRNTWIITKNTDTKGYLNPILKNYLEARFELDWEKKIGLVNIIDNQVVDEVCQKLSSELQIEYLPFDKVVSCPRPDETPHNKILNSIILGTFEPISLKDAQKLPQNLQTRERKQWTTKVASLASNSNQDDLIGAVFDGHQILVEGKSNTGKTHVIASILPSLLIDRGATLIISSQPSAFNDIQYHLGNLGLKDVGILNLQDEVLDKERLIEYLEKLPARVRTMAALDQVEYSKKIDQHHRYRLLLEKAYDSLQQPSIHSWNWPELLGQCLLHHQKSDKQILSRFLDNKLFEFTEKEEQLICNELAEHYRYYHQIDALKHGLNALHGRFFINEMDLEKSKEASKIGVNLYRHKVNRLYQEYLVFGGDYAESIKFDYLDFVASMEQQINKIKDDLHLYNNLYGENFDKQSSFQNAKLKLLSLFSQKHQDIRLAKERLLEDYKKLKETYEAAVYFKTDFPQIEAESKLADVEEKLETLRTGLQEWVLTIPKLVADKTVDLSDETDYPQAFQERYDDLEKDLEKLINQLNKDQVIRKEIVLAQNKLSEKESFLLNLLLQFQKLENEWRDFDDYYRWRKSWLLIDVRTQKVVQALVNTGTYDWLSGFKSWFYHQILGQQYSIDLPKKSTNESLEFDAYLENLLEVQKYISRKADMVTKLRQSEQIRRIKKEKDLTLTNVVPIFKNKKIQDILIWLGLENIGDFFPIVLASPAMAKQLVGLKTAAFDIVFIDDAQDILSKTGTDLLKLGNQQIVLGQASSLILKEKEETLMDWMSKQQNRRYYHLEHTHSKSNEKEPSSNRLSNLEPNTFQKAVVAFLKEYIPEERFQLNKTIEGKVIDLVINPKYLGQPPIAVIFDAGMLNQAKYDFQLAVDKIKILKRENYLIQYIWSVNWWKNNENAMQPLLAYILDWDKKNKG